MLGLVSEFTAKSFIVVCGDTYKYFYACVNLSVLADCSNFVLVYLCSFFLSYVIIHIPPLQ